MSLVVALTSFIAVTAFYIFILMPTRLAVRSPLEKVTALVSLFLVICVLPVVAGICCAFVRFLFFLIRFARVSAVHIVSGGAYIAPYASYAFRLGEAGVQYVGSVAGSWFAKYGPEITGRLSSACCSMNAYVPSTETLDGACAVLLYGLLLGTPIMVMVLLALNHPVKSQHMRPRSPERKEREPQKALKHPEPWATKPPTIKHRPGRKAFPTARERQRQQHEERIAQGFASLRNRGPNWQDAENTRPGAGGAVIIARSSAVTAPLHMLFEEGDLRQCSSTPRVNDLGICQPGESSESLKIEIKTTSPSADDAPMDLTTSNSPTGQLDQLSSTSPIWTTSYDAHSGALRDSNCSTSTERRPRYSTASDSVDVGQDCIALIQTREPNCPPITGTEGDIRATGQEMNLSNDRTSLDICNSNCPLSTDSETVSTPTTQHSSPSCEPKCSTTTAHKENSKSLPLSGQIEILSVLEDGAAICDSNCSPNAEETAAALPSAQEPSTSGDRTPKDICALNCPPSTDVVAENLRGEEHPEFLSTLVVNSVLQGPSSRSIFNRRKKAMSLAQVRTHGLSKHAIRWSDSDSTTSRWRASRPATLDQELDALAALLERTGLDDSYTGPTRGCPDLESCALDSMDLDEADSGLLTPTDGPTCTQAPMDSESWNAMDVDAQSTVDQYERPDFAPVEVWDSQDADGDMLMTENPMEAKPAPMCAGMMDWASVEHADEAIIVPDTTMTEPAREKKDRNRDKPRDEDMAEPVAFDVHGRGESEDTTGGSGLKYWGDSTPEKPAEVISEVAEVRVIKSLPKRRLKRSACL